jgi:polysaccharide export outer membrane protein
MTLLEVLSQAGGIADDAGSVVLVTRSVSAAPADSATGAAGRTETPGKAATPISTREQAQTQTFTIRLNDLLESGSPEFNIPVFGGDIISVPRAGIVYVAGAVERPGGYVLQSDREEMTALKAIALAQGLLGSAKPGEAVIIRKNADTGQNQEIDVDLKKIMSRKSGDVRLYANDILFIPDSAGKRALKRMGEVVLGITSGLVIVRGGR